MVRIFLSHSSKDKVEVRKLAGQLKSRGIDVWIDEEKINVGDSISKKIQQGLRDSDYLCIWITEKAMQSGWVEKEWLPKIKQEIDENRTVVLPLLAEPCKLPAFLDDKKYADFRESFSHGLNDLFQAIGFNSKREARRVLTNRVTELLEDLAKTVIPLPHLTTINILKSLKKIPRSGKIIRLATFHPIVDIRSIYDHILSVAHTADWLIPQLNIELSNEDELNLARCIVYHDICEIFLGDIPRFTSLTDLKRSRASILAEERLKRYSREYRDNITNTFINLFLEEKEQASMQTYQEIAYHDNDLINLFNFLDKVDPIIGVWRYLHHYRGKLDDGKKFLNRLRDFFVYEAPLNVSKKFSSDYRVHQLVSTLRDREKARMYYERHRVEEELFGFDSEIVKQIIENHTIHFVPRKKKLIITDLGGPPCLTI